MKRDFLEIREKARKKILAQPIEKDDDYDLFSDKSIINLMHGQNVDEAMAHIKRTALYMDLPHPEGRDVRGENDFAATRLIVAIYELSDKMTDETKALVKKFFLERDFTSMYGSENHVFMMRVARYLAAQFYNEDFKQFGLTAQEVLKRDKKYIIEFVQFRARYGVGEFTSAYLYEDLFMCSLLAEYAKDSEVKHISQMAVDLLTVEALHNLDGNGFLAGGAGRTYHFLNVGEHCTEGINKIYNCPEFTGGSLNALVMHKPDQFILDAFLNRSLPMEVFEEKHLHSMYAWRSDVPDWAHINRYLQAGSISKYTYLGKKYSIGAINNQDDYPVDESEDFVYAHHQQVEWSLLIPDTEEGGSTKIFSSHPGLTGEHRHWTGDLKCCCSRAYSNKNTVLTTYNIEKEEELDYTHMFLEIEKFDRIEKSENRLFLKKGDVNVFVYVNNPFKIDIKECELVSNGRKNAYVVRVEEDVDFDEFMLKYLNTPVSFDENSMRLEFDGLFLDKNGNGSIENPEKYPYNCVHRSDFVQANWGEGVVFVKNGEKTLVLDFINNRKYVK
jgi:hypothetical protein